MIGTWAAHADFKKFKGNDIRTLVGVLIGHCLIGRYASRLRMPYNDYYRSYQEVDEETIKCKPSYRERIATIRRGFLEEVSEVGTDKTFRIDELPQKHGVVQRGGNRVHGL